MKQDKITYSRSNYIKQLCITWLRVNLPDVHKQLVDKAWAKYPSRRRNLKMEEELRQIISEVKHDVE